MPTTDGLVPAPRLGDLKSYPPLRWRPLRVMNPWHKFGFLVGMVAATAAIGWLVRSLVPGLVAEVAVQVFSTVLLVAIARSFRGQGEPVLPPRAWWRLTARPLAGWWLAVLEFAGPLDLVVSRHHQPVDWVTATTSALLGLAFLNSSIRLTALRRHPQI